MHKGITQQLNCRTTIGRARAQWPKWTHPGNKAKRNSAFSIIYTPQPSAAWTDLVNFFGGGGGWLCVPLCTLVRRGQRVPLPVLHCMGWISLEAPTNKMAFQSTFCSPTLFELILFRSLCLPLPKSAPPPPCSPFQYYSPRTGPTTLFLHEPFWFLFHHLPIRYSASV